MKKIDFGNSKAKCKDFKIFAQSQVQSNEIKMRKIKAAEKSDYFAIVERTTKDFYWWLYASIFVKLKVFFAWLAVANYFVCFLRRYMIFVYVNNCLLQATRLVVLISSNYFFKSSMQVKKSR